MKKGFLVIISILAFSFVFYSFTFNNESPLRENKAERVTFRIKGTGSKGIFVTIGIGSQPGSGSCCSGLSPSSSSSYTGEVGHVVYDGKTRRIITKIYKELQGTTIDLAGYY
jgi:hypothetical protein